MSTDPEKKASILGPIADEYGPTDADADRVLAKIQAALGHASAATSAPTPPASPTASVPPAVGSGLGKKAIFVGLSCAALAILGAFVATKKNGDTTPSAVATPKVQTEVSPPSGAPPSEPRSEPESIPAIPSVSVDSLPTAKAVQAPAKEASKPAEAKAPNAPPDTLEREARLLGDARQARQVGEGARALALLDEHARTFPNGWLAGDRAAERIVVLCSLGRRDEAVREAAVFLNGRPKSPLTRRVEMSCAGVRQ